MTSGKLLLEIYAQEYQTWVVKKHSKVICLLPKRVFMLCHLGWLAKPEPIEVLDKIIGSPSC